MRKTVSNICSWAGVLCLAAALALFAYNYWDAWRAGNAASDILAAYEAALEEAESLAATNPAAATDSSISIDKTAYMGTLQIDALGLQLPVATEWSLQQLKLTPCCYSGSLEAGNLVICAHNYERHFGLLKTIAEDDWQAAITLTTCAGESYVFTIVEIETLVPTAVEEATASGYDLTLLTCTPGGQARVAVRCVQG